MIKVFRVRLEDSYGVGFWVMITAENYIDCVEAVKAEYPDKFITEIKTSKTWTNYTYSRGSSKIQINSL